MNGLSVIPMLRMFSNFWCFQLLTFFLLWTLRSICCLVPLCHHILIEWAIRYVHSFGSSKNFQFSSFRNGIQICYHHHFIISFIRYTSFMLMPSNSMTYHSFLHFTCHSVPSLLSWQHSACVTAEENFSALLWSSQNFIQNC